MIGKSAPWVVALCTALLCAGAPAATAGQAVTDRERVDDPGHCPAVTVLAARGSEQNEQLEPTRYSDQSPWLSNGYEERNLRGFLHYAEERHLAQTGQSLLADVRVLALDDTIYPATLPLPQLAEEGEELDVLQTVQRAGQLLAEKPVNVILDEAFTGFFGSLVSAVDGAGSFIAADEEATGCQTDYILLGYSQGALVLSSLERQLAEEGRLAGVLYLGNPALTAGDVTTVGDPVTGAGLLQLSSDGLWPLAEGTERVNYCLRDDVVCDTTLDSIPSSLGDGGGRHLTYFQEEEHTAADAVVADRFADWVGDYTSQP